MKLLFFITRADTIGGAQIHVRDVARTLTQKGHQVLVITGIRGLYNIALKQNGIQSLEFETFQQKINLIQDGKTLALLIKTIREFQPDIVSTHSSKAGIIGRFACKLTNTPCIFTAHGWAFTQGVPEPTRTVYQWLEQQSEPLADKIICVSDYDRLIGIKAGMKPDKLLRIHNGMPDIPYDLKANPLASNPVRIAMVARFDKQKDHLTLIKAFQNLLGAQLYLVGDGPKLEEVKDFVQQLGITERVKFFGYCDNVAEILAQVQIFSLISHWEGFPRSILEAMRAGIPVVASDVAGVAEAVIDGVTGYCVPRGDVDVLQARLAQLVYDAELRGEMGNRGRQRYESEFTFERMFEQTFTVYENVLKERGNRM